MDWKRNSIFLHISFLVKISVPLLLARSQIESSIDASNDSPRCGRCWSGRTTAQIKIESCWWAKASKAFKRAGEWQAFVFTSIYRSCCPYSLHVSQRRDMQTAPGCESWLWRVAPSSCPSRRRLRSEKPHENWKQKQLQKWIWLSRESFLKDWNRAPMETLSSIGSIHAMPCNLCFWSIWFWA